MRTPWWGIASRQKTYKVGVEVVRDLYGAMAAKGATGGFVVTSGTFTDAAEDFAHSRHLKLLDGSKLRLMIGRTQRGEPVTPRCYKCFMLHKPVGLTLFCAHVRTDLQKHRRHPAQGRRLHQRARLHRTVILASVPQVP
nr:restriction endonuclease [Thiomonas arsenitoxydans]